MRTNIKWDDDKAKREVTLTLTWAEAWDITLAFDDSPGDPTIGDELADALEDAATEDWTFESYSELVRSGHLVVIGIPDWQVVGMNDAAMRLAFDQFMGNVKTDQRLEAQVAKRFAFDDEAVASGKLRWAPPDLTFDDQERGF